MSIAPHTVLTALSAQRTVSGSTLAEQFGVTRAAVWKQIEHLRKLGAPIEAVAGSGYRLSWPIESLDAAAIKHELNTSMRARLGEVQVHWQIDSTNTLLLQQASQGTPNLSVCVAETQSGGRGRRGRNWQSRLGGNIYFSLLRRFSGGMGALSGLSLVAGVALMQALQDCGVSGIGLKWPNDVLADGRKLAGVLVELGGEFLGPCFGVIGIGINLRLPTVRDIDQPCTDLAALCGNDMPSRNRLIGRLIERLSTALDRFEAQGFVALRDDFARYDVLVDQKIDVRTAADVVSGIAAGVDARGALRVRVGAQTASFDSAEVSVRRT